MSKQKTKKVNRDAETGQFATGEYAAENPKTTVTETVPTGKGQRKASELAKAVKTLTDALRNDSDFYFAYQSNIAMAFYDAMKPNLNEPLDDALLHETANEAAKKFLDLWLSQAVTDEQPKGEGE